MPQTESYGRPEPREGAGRSGGEGRATNAKGGRGKETRTESVPNCAFREGCVTPAAATRGKGGRVGGAAFRARDKQTRFPANGRTRDPTSGPSTATRTQETASPAREGPPFLGDVNPRPGRTPLPPPRPPPASTLPRCASRSTGRGVLRARAPLRGRSRGRSPRDCSWREDSPVPARTGSGGG